MTKSVGNKHGQLRAGGKCMFLDTEVGGNSRPHNDGAGPLVGFIHVHAVLPLSTSMAWIWSLHQLSVISLFLVIEYIRWEDLSTLLEAKNDVTEEEARAQELSWVGVLFTGWWELLLLAHVHP